MKSKEALHSVHQGPKETLEDLGRRITELTQKAYRPNQHEEEGVYTFLGVALDKLSKKIVIQGYETLVCGVL